MCSCTSHSAVGQRAHEYSLEDLLDNEKERNVLRQFLLKTNHSESLVFLEMVEEYTLLNSHGNRYKKAQVIVNAFIAPKNCSVIHITEESRSKVLQEFEKSSSDFCPRTLFECCLNEVLLHLKNELWSQFLISDEYVRLLQINHIDNDISVVGYFNNIGIDMYNPFITDREFNLVKQWCFSERIANTKWKSVLDKRHVKAFTTRKNVRISAVGRETKMSKVELLLQESPLTVLRSLLTSSLRLEFDGYLSEIEKVDYKPYDQKANQYGYTLLLELYKLPFIKNRIYNFSATVREETFTTKNWKRYIIFKKTIKDESLKEKSRQKKAIAAECLHIIIVEQTDDNATQTRFIEISWMDIKGNVPIFIWNKIITGRGKNLERGLKKMICKYKSLMIDRDSAEFNTDHLWETFEENIKHKGVIRSEGYY
jgi:hypothetical protein